MKPVIRFQSQLLLARSYKAGRRIAVTFRPSRAAVLPIAQAAVPRSGANEILASEINRASSGAAFDSSDSAGWCSQSAHLPETQKVSVRFRLQRPDFKPG